MKIFNKNIIIIIATLIATLNYLNYLNSQNTYYISPSGDDNSGNGSLNYPWATLQYAINQANNSDTIIIGTGDYNYTTSIIINKELTIKGDYSSIQPSLLFNDAEYHCITIQANNVTIENLRLYRNGHSVGANSALLSVPSGGSYPNYTVKYSNLTVKKCTFEWGKYGMMVNINNMLVDSCNFINQYRNAIILYGTKGIINITNNYVDGTIRNARNLVYITTGSGQPYCEGTINIEYNKSYKKSQFFLIDYWGDVSKKINLYIKHNTIDYATSKPIIFYWPPADGFSKFNSIIIEDNIITNSQMGIVIDFNSTDNSSLPANDQIVVNNNLFFNNTDHTAYTKHSANPNIGWRTDGAYPPGASDNMFLLNNNISSDPLYDDTSHLNQNFKLKTGSPAINTASDGTNIGADQTIPALIAGVTITANPSGITCAGGNITFTATPINGGSNPSFQWKVNGIDLGIDTSVFSTSTLNDKDTVICIMTSNEPGVIGSPATSNPIILSFDYTNIWTGNVNNDWNDPNNWSCGIVPLSYTNVIIESSPNQPVISSNNAVCNNITINSNASLTITSGNILTISGNLTNNGNTNLGTGKIIFDGNTQITSGNLKIQNLKIDTGSITEISGNCEISGILLCNGTLNITGSLTLTSSTSYTGLIDGTSTGTINGVITQQRFVEASKAKGYKHIASAFSDVTIGQCANFMDLYLGNVNDSPYPTIFKFSETDATPYFEYGWVAAAPKGQINTLMEVGRGYIAQFGTGSLGARTIAFTGHVNNGDISCNVTLDNPGNAKGNGWNLVGNPYPSPIDLDKLPYDNANLNKSVSIFISTAMYKGYYGYYNAKTHLAINGGTRYLPALHAFFVQCNNAAGGTLTFKNSMRANIINPNLYKYTETPNYPYIKLSAKLLNEDAALDETIIMFNDSASLNFDPEYDIFKLYNTDPEIPNLYSISNNNKLALNCLNNTYLKNNFEIPLGLEVQKADIYVIKADAITNLPPELSVILVDNKLNKCQDLQTNPTYIFPAYPSTTPDKNRFTLKIGQLQTHIDESSYNQTLVSIWQEENIIKVKIIGQKSYNASLEIIDALGRLIIKTYLPSDGTYNISNSLKTGNYIVRYVNENYIENFKLFVY